MQAPALQFVCMGLKIFCAAQVKVENANAMVYTRPNILCDVQGKVENANAMVYRRPNILCAVQVKVENANVMVYMAEQKFSAERLRKQLGKPVRVSAFAGFSASFAVFIFCFFLSAQKLFEG